MAKKGKKSSGTASEAEVANETLSAHEETQDDPAEDSSERDESAESMEDEAAKDDQKEKKKKKKHRNKLDAQHPPTTEMILDALKNLDSKKGVSIPAIKEYIMRENTVRPETLSHLMRKALSKLLEKQVIMRPKGEETKSVLLGRYRIVPTKEKERPRSRPSTLRNLGSVKPKSKKKRKKYGFY